VRTGDAGLDDWPTGRRGGNAGAIQEDDLALAASAEDRSSGALIREPCRLADGARSRLLVEDADNLRWADGAIRRIVISLVVAIRSPLSFGLLVAIVRRADAPVLGLGLARGNRHRRHLNVLIFSIVSHEILRAFPVWSG
jgi:hypothetical protein